MTLHRMQAWYRSLQPLLLWQHVERPIIWSQHFGRTAPMVVEIGFGNGEFLVREAQQYPQCNLVGIECEWTSVQHALRKIVHAGVSNVRLLLVEAQMALERLFMPQSITRLYALFPCPWPKERHAHHRLFHYTFLRLLNSRLTLDGSVQMVTDHIPYLDWVLTQVPDTGWRVQWSVVAPRFRTKYERKWQASGQHEFYDLRLHKTQHLTMPVREDMPLQIHHVPHFDPSGFAPGTLRQGDITVACKDWLYDPLRQTGMLRVIVVEGEFRQDFWLDIARRQADWVIRPARGCGIIPTLGVQCALDLVRDATQPPSPEQGER